MTPKVHGMKPIAEEIHYQYIYEEIARIVSKNLEREIDIGLFNPIADILDPFLISIIDDIWRYMK